MRYSSESILKTWLYLPASCVLILCASISSAQFNGSQQPTSDRKAFWNTQSTGDLTPFYDELNSGDRSPDVEARGDQIDRVIHPTKPLTSYGAYDIKVTWPAHSGATSYVFKIERDEPFPYVRTYQVPKNRKYLRILAGRVYRWYVIPLGSDQRPLAKASPSKSILVVHPGSEIAGSSGAD